MPSFDNDVRRDAGPVDPLAGSLPKVDLPEGVRFEKLTGTGGCQGGQCPTVYQRAGDSENLYIQWHNLEAEELQALDVPRGESLVRIPRSLIKELQKGGALAASIVMAQPIFQNLKHSQSTAGSAGQPWLDPAVCQRTSGEERVALFSSFQQAAFRLETLANTSLMLRGHSSRATSLGMRAPTPGTRSGRTTSGSRCSWASPSSESTSSHGSSRTTLSSRLTGGIGTARTQERRSPWCTGMKFL